jgi:hypothetical protein
MSCLFQSISKLLGNISPQNLRNQICDFIETNGDRMWNGLSIKEWVYYSAIDRNQTVKQYIQSMRHSSEWGGAPEIAICCIIKGINIVVVQLHKNKEEIEFVQKNGKYTIKISYTGYHYEPINIILESRQYK